MDDDILIDVFRPLPRKQLSQSVALVCRRFRYLVNSPALPNLHYINCTGINPHRILPFYPKCETWGFVIDDGPRTPNLITYELLQTTHRPNKYLRFGVLFINANHLAKEHWRKCLWEFRQSFVDCTLKLSIYAEMTAVEFQCFLADWVLRLFPNCVYAFSIGRIISSNENKRGDMPTLEELTSYTKSKFLQFGASDRQAIASSLKPSLLISLPSIFNCLYVKMAKCDWRYPDALLRNFYFSDAFWEASVPQEDVMQWLHHVPTVPTTIRLNRVLCKSKRNLFLSGKMIKRNKEDRSYHWDDPIAEVAHNLIMLIKQKFLLAKTPEEKREFYLELDVYTRADTRHLQPFVVQNNATNERLTLQIFSAENSSTSTTWKLLRESV
ncbi:f-box-like domain-containing protein [Ditylenchus destructor]|uniref:F-box-like domain-containing protein n=1 Tax=Ditylenchus destructor TaxID=166010 RepID=A0AAD4QWI3_9BILA|nr:f-box-like domain-containing protein [Ditylenchus destructor]